MSPPQRNWSPAPFPQPLPSKTCSFPPTHARTFMAVCYRPCAIYFTARCFALSSFLPAIIRFLQYCNAITATCCCCSTGCTRRTRTTLPPQTATQPWSSSAHPHSPAHHRPPPLSQTRELCCGCFAGVEYHSQCRGGARCIAQCRPIQPRARKCVGRAERRHRMESLRRPMATHHRSCFCVHGRGCQASQRRQRCRHDISTWRHRRYPGTLCARNRTHRSDNGVSRDLACRLLQNSGWGGGSLHRNLCSRLNRV